ncbi:YjdF family protein [Butyrivibrio sp. WCD2001]|uniref:YjdF family protein n=1 Tax=Butyrivibrio sp. WCD2001 TaxID=1280681 RepID=UPI00047911D0|nr:YjdF family protein [Butyrivibrio sp. WCD2001]
MSRTSVNLTVYFDDPFWVGVFERFYEGKLSVCKVTFGAEPKDYDIWEFVLRHYYDLEFSPAVDATIKEIKDNPKRRQRDAAKQMRCTGIGTKSQQALQLQREEMKIARKIKSRQQVEEEKQRQFELKQLKKIEKHKGH